MTENTQTKHNPEKANKTKHSKTKLHGFSRLLQYSARKQSGLILQCSHTGLSHNKHMWLSEYKHEPLPPVRPPPEGQSLDIW